MTVPIIAHNMGVKLCFLLTLAITFIAVGSIRLEYVGVPSYAIQGQKAVLECAYDLEGMALYSVKWYKNGLEFFRYLPKNDIPVTYYFREGVTVDKKNSNSRQVTLINLQQSSTGRYRCEVSTEAPSFATVSNYGDMMVVVLPKQGPRITGGQQRYSLGDTVDVNCTSYYSKPAADLKWFVNSQPADERLLIEYPIRNNSRELHTSTLGLRFPVERDHFSEDGDMKLKCTASIGSIYWQTNEKSAESYKQKRAPKGLDQNDYVRESYAPALDSPHGLSSGWNGGDQKMIPLYQTFPILAAVTLALL